MLGRARELGINFLDTAECYGDHAVESLIGKSIKKRRAEWIVATKFGHAHAGSPQKTEAWLAHQVRQQLEDSLRTLQTDHIDLYQFHSGGNAAFQNEALWTLLHEQVRAGKIRRLGLSLAADLMLKNDLQQLHAAPRLNVSVVQVVYNRLQKKAEEQVLPFCQAQQLGVLARSRWPRDFWAGTTGRARLSPKTIPARPTARNSTTGNWSWSKKSGARNCLPARTWPNGLWPGA